MQLWIEGFYDYGPTDLEASAARPGAAARAAGSSSGGCLRRLRSSLEAWCCCRAPLEGSAPAQSSGKHSRTAWVWPCLHCRLSHPSKTGTMIGKGFRY